MNRLAVILIVALLVGAPLAQGNGPLEETKATLQLEMLRLINKDRHAYGLPPVQLDPQASATAESYCRQQIRNRTTGHFTLDGLAPYMRYSFAGGNDGVSENAAAWSANYAFSDLAIYEMLRRSQDAMMAEMAPHDGHRRTILDPHATHVGIGLAWEKGEFRLAQHFIRRYVDWNRPLPRAAALHEPVVATGRPLNGYRIEAITVHHEPIPQSISAQVASAIRSYSLPAKRREYLPRLRKYFHRGNNGTIHQVSEEYADGRRGDFRVAEDGSFSFAVPFTEGPGIYTVVTWVARPGAKRPISASNISIRVDRPAPDQLSAGTVASR